METTNISMSVPTRFPHDALALSWLVRVAHGDERPADRRRADAGGLLRARERGTEAAAHAYHFAGGAHFRAEDRVPALERGEREDCQIGIAACRERGGQ